jgi:hypothetical protein
VARDRGSGGLNCLDYGIVGDLGAGEGEGDAGRHGIGRVGWLVEALGLVGLFSRSFCPMSNYALRTYRDGDAAKVNELALAAFDQFASR